MDALLVRHLLESTLLCGLLGGVACCLQGQRAAARHMLWLIGIAKFLAPTFLLTAAGAQIAFLLPATAWLAYLAAQASALLVALFGNWPAHVFTGHVTAIFCVLLAVWLSGSGILFGSWLIRLRRSGDGLTAAGSEETEALERAKRRLGMTAPLEIHFSDQRREPALAGIFRPIVTIARGLSERLTSAEFEAVLLHEVAHSRRRDNLSSAFVHGVVCLFWFHPLLWFAERRLIVERERACDEAVIQAGIRPRIYLAGLVKVCQFHIFPDAIGVGAVSGSDLTARFDRILGSRRCEPVPYLVRFLLAGLAIFLTVLPIAGGYCEQCGTGYQNAAGQEQSLR